MEQIQGTKAITNQTDNISIPVVHNRIKNNQVTALHLMASILFIVLGFLTWIMPPQTNEWKQESWSTAGIAFAVFGLLILISAIFFNKKIIQKRNTNLGLRIFEILAMAAIIFYTLYQRRYMPLTYSSAAMVALVFAFFWEKSATKDFRIHLMGRGVSLPRFIAPKFILWQDIEKVLFKFDLLTIVCRNNKVYQFHTRKGQFPDASKANNLCKNKIEENKSLYKSDW
jgi:hypothetical protein